jgi:hypothetical protein
MTKVIVTMTTLPRRLFEVDSEWGIRPSLKTILEQSNADYEVHLNVPYEHRGQQITVPDWLREWQSTYKHLKVFRCKDYGPITKIYPTLKRVTDPNTILITVDDDLAYNDGFVQAHIDAQTKYKECAIGYAGMGSINESLPADNRGVHPTGGQHFVTSLAEDIRVRMLEGYKTVSYLRSFFSEDLKDLENFMAQHWNDDIVLSAYMGYKNIKKIVLKCENCNGDNSPRVETFPVIRMVPITSDIHGCNAFRTNQSIQKNMEDVSNMWYKLGYLER